MEKMAFAGVNLLGAELSQQRNEPQQSPKAGRRPTLSRKSRSHGAGKQSRRGFREVAGNREGLERPWLLLREGGPGRVPKHRVLWPNVGSAASLWFLRRDLE